MERFFSRQPVCHATPVGGRIEEHPAFQPDAASVFSWTVPPSYDEHDTCIIICLRMAVPRRWHDIQKRERRGFRDVKFSGKECSTARLASSAYSSQARA